MFMEQFKRVQIILLETNNKSNIWSHKGRRLYYNQNNPNDVDDEIRYNIYIISDDEIKEGDWKHNSKMNCIVQHNREGKGLPDELKIASEWCKKIIATTDTSLKINSELSNSNSIKFQLPQPSQQFIEKYIESYNKGEIITDVLVEYEQTKLYIEPQNYQQYISLPLRN